MADDQYANKVYHEQGGDQLVVKSGGIVLVESGGLVDATAATGLVTVAAGEWEAADLATSAVTAAKLATDAVETAKLKDAAVTQAKLEEGSVVFIDKQLTNAEVLAFRATPIELIAAPGANKAIVVHKFHIVSDDSGGAWTESADDLVIEYADGVDISAAIEAGDLVGGAVVVKAQGVLSTALVPDVNAAVQIFNTGDGEWGGGNAANTMSIRIWYSVVDTVAFS